MKKKSTKLDKLKFITLLRRQFRKYLRYTIKWFPFSVLIGLVSGVLMATFTALVVNLQLWISFIPLYITYPVVGLVTTILLYFGFNEIKGAGISYILLHKNTGRSIPLRALITKFFASLLTLGAGAPAGREGPAVTLGSAMASKIGEKLKMSTEDVTNAITIGSAACTAAIFRTPLGGTVFAAEVPYKRDLDETVFLPSLLASAIALSLSNYILTCLSSHPVYLETNIGEFHLDFVFAIHCIVLGTIAGFIGILFSLFFKHFYKTFSRRLKVYLLPVVGMSITGIIVFFVDLALPGEISLKGTGFSAINGLLEDYYSINIAMIALLLVGKIIATSTCIGFFNSGGVMGPSLVVGAALGALYDHLFPSKNYLALMIVAMSAMHTATTKTPIASMLLVLEMVGFPNLVVPIILSNTMSFIISMDFSLYSGQIESKEIILRKKIQHTDLLETLLVQRAMTTKYCSLKPEEPLTTAVETFYKAKVPILPVVNERNELVGVVARADFQKGFAKKLKKVQDIMTTDIVIAFPDETLFTAFDRLTEHKIESMPVVDRDNRKKLLGFIGFNEIERCYERQLVKIHQNKGLTIEEISNDL